MVIQCPACTTKYRLNLESLPNRKTFVKCRNCGTPIYIDPPADAAAAAPGPPTASHAPPAAPGKGGPDKSEVACPQCGTRYRVPTEALRKAGVRLKCTHCANVFTPPGTRGAAPMPPESEPVPPPVPPASASTREFFPAAESGQDSAAPMERPMPIPDDQQLEGMFDDLRDRNTPFAAEPKPSQPKAPPPKAPPVQPPAHPVAAPALDEEVEESTDALLTADLDHLGEDVAVSTRPRRPSASAFNPEQAYLEAISLDDDTPMKSPRPPRGTVPPEQKYRFFLKPGALPEEFPAPPAPKPAAPRAPAPQAPPIPPPKAAAPAPEVQGALDDEIAPPPRVMDVLEQPQAGAPGEPGMEAAFDTAQGGVDSSGVDLDAAAGQLEREAAQDDVDALLRDEGLDSTPLPDLPRLPPEPMHRPGSGVHAIATSMAGLRGQAFVAGILALAGGLLALAFWLGFKLG